MKKSVIFASLLAICANSSANANTNHLECLALNIYHEARGESLEGQAAVAHVTINRVNHEWFPNSICQVVYQSSQFSWVHQRRNHTPQDTEAWNRALLIANSFIEGEFSSFDPTEGATFYHAVHVNPPWNNQMELIDTVGVHEFYYWDGTWD